MQPNSANLLIRKTIEKNFRTDTSERLIERSWVPLRLLNGLGNLFLIIQICRVCTWPIQNKYGFKLVCVMKYSKLIKKFAPVWICAWNFEKAVIIIWIERIIVSISFHNDQITSFHNLQSDPTFVNNPLKFSNLIRVATSFIILGREEACFYDGFIL